MRILIFVFVFVLITSQIFAQIKHVDYYDTTYMKLGLFELKLKDSLPDGRYIVYFPCENKSKNSNLSCEQIKQIVTYKDYNRTGLFIEYQIDDGIHFLSSFVYYKNGIKDGEFISFNKHGEIVLKGNYNNGKRNGDWLMIRKVDRYIVKYEMDIIKQWKQVDVNGKIIAQGTGTPKFLLNLTNP